VEPETGNNGFHMLALLNALRTLCTIVQEKCRLNCGVPLPVKFPGYT